MLRLLSLGAFQLHDPAAFLAIAPVCDDATIAVGVVVVIKVNVGREGLAEVQHIDFAVELVVGIGGRRRGAASLTRSQKATRTTRDSSS